MIVRITAESTKLLEVYMEVKSVEQAKENMLSGVYDNIEFQKVSPHTPTGGWNWLDVEEVRK